MPPVVVPAPVRFVLAALVIAWLAQCALYWPTVRQLPFGDDWGPPLSEIARGEFAGPLSFFRETRQPDSYRPAQSLLIWLFGRVDEPRRWASIRALHFLSSGVAFVVLALLLRQWRFGRAGVAVAAVVAALHPTLVAPVGSIDGFSSVLSCAAVWWGVWMMGEARGRAWLGLTLAAVALVVGSLVKEYAFAMTPTSVLAAWFLYRPRWRSAIITAVAMGALTVFLLWVRRYTKPADMALPPGDFAVESPMLFLANAALVLIGGFFFGDALWLYVARDAAAIGVAAVVLAATACCLGGGLWLRLRTSAERPAPGFLGSPRCAAAFLALSIPAVTFPANVVMRMSEMYLCGLVFTVALLAALAADGWAGDPSRGRRVAAGALAALLAVAATLAVRHKTRAMLALGERAEVQLAQLDPYLTDAPPGTRVLLLHRRDQIPPRATFSSYRLPDAFLIRPPMIDCRFPRRGLALLAPSPLPDEASVRAADRSQADVVLYWDVARARYERLK